MTSPNPMVGAVVVTDDGTVVGQGFHERAGGPHAEVRALDEAGLEARGATLYCTLEPCSHAGRTGPCVERIAAAGVARVVASTSDPNPLVAGRGFQMLRDRGIQVVLGPGRERALRLNRPFFTFITERRPFVIAKSATSLDNCVSPARGVRGQISSRESILHAQRIRAEVDAIGVGSETVLVDDPQLTVRDVSRRRPLVRVVFDRRLRISPAARLFSTLDAGPVIIVTTAESLGADEGRARALEAAGAELEPAGDTHLLPALRRLAERELMSLLLEGGPTLHKAAAAERLIDAVQVYVAPDPVGSAGVHWLEPQELRIASLADRHVVPCGRDVFMEGYVHGID
jgi:diaminohydroxyphosphoribosylaminopyrimidine deaminase/5-amino-6-(5-phosphoribosylamino)uracil reductase